MSVDVNHRTQFCSVLMSEFRDVQFVITTHDQVWARQMQASGLVSSKKNARFYGWSVDGGPIYEMDNIWDRIEDDLAKDDVPGAAHKLRRHLEAVASDLAARLGGKVTYKADGNYDLSVLLDSVRSRHGDLLKLASAAAQSWGKTDVQEQVKTLKEHRSRVVPEHASQSWLINPVVHNNDWANVSVADFRPTLEATKEFLSLFTCENDGCTGWIHTVGFPSPESLRCDCGDYNLNLSKKPS